MKWLSRSLKLLLTLAVLSTPVLGVWLASSLAAFFNGPVFVAVASGLLLFPLLPALWDLWAMRRRVKRGQKPEERVLTSGDRLIVRTFVVNTLFLVVLLGLFPQAAFTALSTRGDWMIEGRDGAVAELTRRGLFGAADGLEWLYLAYRDNPFEEMGEGEAPPPPTPEERGEVSTGTAGDGETDDGKADDGKADDGKADDGKADDGKADDGQADDGRADDGRTDDGRTDDGKADDGRADDGRTDDGQADDGRADDGRTDDGQADDGRADDGRTDDGQADDGRTDDGEADDGEADDGEADDGEALAERGASWPMSGSPHRLIAELPVQERSSIRDVGRYLAEHERDPYRLVKALHDFSATHVRYDFEALDAGAYPPQDAETVFRTGRGVCAGYANLLAALGDAAGMEVVYITGDSRDQGGEIGGAGHAWNAAKIDGRWYLIDATWDAGHREGGTFKQDYKTDYLFTPPRFFAQGHLPDDPAWQLLDEPLSRGEFMRQPMLDPAFHMAGLRLVSPTRSQVTVEGAATVEIANPEGKYLMLTYRDKAFANDTSRAEECVASGRASVTVTCDLPRSGTYLIMLFLNEQRFGTYTSIGQIEINRS